MAYTAEQKNRIRSQYPDVSDADFESARDDDSLAERIAERTGDVVDEVKGKLARLMK